MDSIVKQSIESRKNAFFNAYEINDKKYLDMVDDLFNRINEFGEACTDVSDFETKFASSDLNQEYIDLFTMIATNCKMIEHEKEYDQNKTNPALDDLKSEAQLLAEDITMPARHEARVALDDKVRDIPVVGDVIQAKQTFDLFKKFKK